MPQTQVWPKCLLYAADTPKAPPKTKGDPVSTTGQARAEAAKTDMELAGDMQRAGVLQPLCLRGQSSSSACSLFEKTKQFFFFLHL